jgi:hypothetical protein
MRKIIALVLLLLMISSCTLAIDYPFSDLKIQQFDNKGKPLLDAQKNFVYEPHWALKEIDKLTKIKLIDGFPDGTFKPEDTITKGQYIKMIIILATNRSFDFTRIPTASNHWAAPYLAVAEMQNVVDKGKYSAEDLDKPITRIEMVSILSRIQINMKNIEQYRQGKLYYTDLEGLTDKEKELLLHATKYELLEGMLESKEFQPNKNITRAEAVVSIYRVY